MDEITRTVLEKGDLAHLALFLWASGASAAALLLLREVAARMVSRGSIATRIW